MRTRPRRSWGTHPLPNGVYLMAIRISRPPRSSSAMMGLQAVGARDTDDPRHADVSAPLVVETGANDPVLRLEGSSVTNAG